MFEFIIQDDGDVYFVLLDMRYIFTFQQQKRPRSLWIYILFYENVWGGFDRNNPTLTYILNINMVIKNKSCNNNYI